MDFSKLVPDSLVCNWFYAFYLVNLAAFVLLLGSFLYYLFSASASATKTIMNARFLTSLVTLAIAGTNSMFFYIICNRSLAP